MASSITADCLVFVPLETSAPLYSPDAPGSGFVSILDRARALLPIEDFRVFTSSDPITKTVFGVEIFCGPIPIPPFWACVPVPYIEEVPFDLPGDQSWALFWVAFRKLFSGGISDCEGDTHWVGTVHQDIAAFNGIGGLSGMTLEDLVEELPAIPLPSTPMDSSMVVRMSPGPVIVDGVTQPGWNSPMGGRTLAHEFGHNSGRKHIDQTLSGAGCGATAPDGPWDEIPFDHCSFGSGDMTLSSTHFGFDPLSRVVIPPTMSGDLMTYASSRWISQQTLEATFQSTFFQALAPELQGRYRLLHRSPVCFWVPRLRGSAPRISVTTVRPDSDGCSKSERILGRGCDCKSQKTGAAARTPALAMTLLIAPGP